MQRRSSLIVAVSTLLAGAGLWPIGRAAEPTFEVASVKPTLPGSIGFTSISPYGTGRFTATSVTLEVLIELMFGVSQGRAATT